MKKAFTVEFDKKDLKDIVTIINGLPMGWGGFEPIFVMAKISAEIQEYIQDNDTFCLYENLRVGSVAAEYYSEAVKMHLDIFEGQYEMVIADCLERYYNNDAGNMYDDDEQDIYQRDIERNQLKGLYDTHFGDIYITKDAVGKVAVYHHFER